MLGEQTILTCGLDYEQNELVRSCIPTKNYCVVDVTDCPTDLIAVGATVLIVNGELLDTETREGLFACFADAGCCNWQTLLWFGELVPPKPLQKLMRCFGSFDELSEKLKYLLLSAHSKVRKTEDFSKKLSSSLKILAMIRKRPGISTRELSERTELPVRTVQRLITALQVAGEWIEYDTKSRGWRLQNGVSILYEDHLEDENLWTMK